MTNIHKQLKQLRMERHYTQEDVASKLGLTRQAISSYESGRTQPSIDILMRFAEIYDVELDEILHGSTMQKKKSHTFHLTSWIIIFLWTGFQLVNLTLLVIAHTFYPIIINPDTQSELRQNELYYRLSNISSVFDQGALSIMFDGCIVLIFLAMLSKTPYALKDSRKHLLSVLLVSLAMLALSYLFLPKGFVMNTFVTIRFSWYILMVTCLIVVTIQWIKKKIKALR